MKGGMDGRKIALVNVGSNTEHGSLRSPLFNDGTFEFVPIPDDKIEGLPTYASFKTSGGVAASEFIPRSFLNKTMHDDPEFLTHTFGDRPENAPRVANLKRLVNGDSILFLARLVEWKGRRSWGKGGFFLIGELVLDGIVKKADLAANSQLVNIVRNNAHVKRWLLRPDIEPDNFWIFIGARESRRFLRAVPFDMAMAQKVLLSSGGKQIETRLGRTENEIINFYTRAARIIQDPSRIEMLRGHISMHCSES